MRNREWERETMKKEDIKKVLASEYQELETQKEELREKTRDRNITHQEKQALFKSIADKKAMQVEIVRIWMKIFNTNIFSIDEIIKELD